MDKKTENGVNIFNYLTDFDDAEYKLLCAGTDNYINSVYDICDIAFQDESIWQY